MALDESPSPPLSSVENNFQPFFVLHKASPPRKSAAKTRRRIELSPNAVEDSPEGYNENLRFETFKFLWSRNESTIKEVLKNNNAEVFDKIDKWISESFNSICAYGKLDYISATRPYPHLDKASISTSVASHQIFTALLCTKNMEFVDDILTFVDLGAHLRSRGRYVANLTSLDFTAKNGVGGCLKSLVRQFLMVGIDAPDISILASWYTEQGNTGNPMIVIIDDTERCCGAVLTDFIIMLREWFIKIPIILILGVATTDGLRNNLSSNACSYLSLCEFTLGTPAKRMDAVIEAVLMNKSYSFGIGKQVSVFLRNYFLRHDGTLTFFVRALKIAMVQHVYMEPLSFTLKKLVQEEETEGIGGGSTLGKNLVKRALELPSPMRSCQSRENRNDYAHGLSELKRLRKLWSSMVMCLYEVGKYHKITLLDLYCDMLEPVPCDSRASDHLQLSKDNSISSYNRHLLGCFQNGGWVNRAIQIVRDMPAVELCKLLKSWEMLTSGINEIHDKVMELQSLEIHEENRQKQGMTDISKRSTARNNFSDKMDETKIKAKVATFLECMVRECMQPTESMPSNEIFLFNNVDKLQAALTGDPRRRIQTDLLESQKFLKCSCCSKSSGVLSPSMHDTSIMYSLAQEHGDLINLHEWFHSFKEIVSQPRTQAKQRLRLSPSPKKRKACQQPQNQNESSMQARFCRAITELQIAGLLRMPSKRRPDYVQRVAFGL
ncbi:hypothetical protein ACJIZ3_024242 [Penstemon smallii]|uniref:Origin of replication complex subunit 3 n=1 Tax=Penstemon smallii TaxID=265156 RepID=A0ABD3TSM2_9LAMI